MITRIAALLGALLLFPSLEVLAAGAPSDSEMIAKFHARKGEFERLKEYLLKTNTKVFGPGYGEFAALRQNLGIKRFYVTDRGQPAFRFPIYVSPSWTRFTPGLTKGYAWLPPTPNFPNYPGAVYMVDPDEPKTLWIVGQNLDSFRPAGKSRYVVELRRIEGDWYLFADNNPYRRSW